MSACPPWLAALVPDVGVMGDPALLAGRPVAVVGSRACPGFVLIAAADWAESWTERGGGRPTLAGGFHTPVEAEVFRRLVRGGAPTALLPARRLPRRLPPDQRAAVEAGRLVIASPFTAARTSKALARRRNTLLARAARAAVILHAAPGSQTLDWSRSVLAARLPLYTLDHPSNGPLRALGARPLNDLP